MVAVSVKKAVVMAATPRRRRPSAVSRYVLQPPWANKRLSTPQADDRGPRAERPAQVETETQPEDQSTGEHAEKHLGDHFPDRLHQELGDPLAYPHRTPLPLASVPGLARTGGRSECIGKPRETRGVGCPPRAVTARSAWRTPTERVSRRGAFHPAEAVSYVRDARPGRGRDGRPRSSIRLAGLLGAAHTDLRGLVVRRGLGHG